VALREIVLPWLHGDMTTVRGLAAVLAVAALTFTVPTTSQACVTTTQSAPAVDLSATPPGWVPVALGDAQVSVPQDFPVVYSGPTSLCRSASPSGPGGLLVDTPLGETVHCLAERHATMVYWSSVPHPSSVAFEHIQKKSILLNGVRVHRILTAVTYAGYYAPFLGVEVIGQGPLANRILATLTLSPRAVALASGSAPAVPSDWKTVTFQGLALAAPAWWPVTRTLYNYGIDTPCASSPGVSFFDDGVGGGEVVLSTDRSLAAFPCGVWVNPGPVYPGDGVEVDAGSRALSEFAVESLHLAFSKRCDVLHGLTACSATTPAYSILVLKVTVPGRHAPLYVSIGLAGNGMVARTILYSLRAASQSEALGSLSGTFVAVGGVASGSPRPLPGQVTAENAAGHKFTVTVGKSGRFVLSLLAGVYRLTGRSPMFSVNGVAGTCAADQPVRVKAGKTTLGVEVVCPLK